MDAELCAAVAACVHNFLNSEEKTPYKRTYEKDDDGFEDDGEEYEEYEEYDEYDEYDEK